MIRPLSLLVCLIASSLQAAPGLQMRGEKLLLTPGAAGLATGWHDTDTADGLRTVVLTEILLWRRASNAPAETEAAKIRSWNQVSDARRMDALPPDLTLLLWLEARWNERHTSRPAALNMAAFRAWEGWLQSQILRLQGEVSQQQASHKAFLAEWEAKPAEDRGRNQVAEKNNATMMTVWAQQRAERLRKDREKQLANDPLAPFKEAILADQEKISGFNRRLAEGQ